MSAHGFLERQLRAGAMLTGSSTRLCVRAPVPDSSDGDQLSCVQRQSSGDLANHSFLISFSFNLRYCPKIQPVLTANRNHLSSKRVPASSVIVQLKGRLRL